MTSDIPDPYFPPTFQYVIVMWHPGPQQWMTASGPIANEEKLAASLNYFRRNYPGRDIRTMIATTSYGMAKPHQEES